MSEPIFISIIIPVYNSEKYIERCVRSVMRQTYQGTIECILVDDCGTDASIAVIETLIANYDGNKKFIILHHTHNQGPSCARNTGINAAEGEYIFFLDSDDELAENCIELLAEQVELHPNIQCVQGFTISKPPKEYFDTTRFAAHQYIEDNSWVRTNTYVLKNGIPFEVWNKLLNKKFLLKHNLYFNPQISIGEDLHWMFFVAKSLSSIAFVFTPTYVHYFDNNESLMSTLTKEKNAKNYKIVLFDWLEHIDSMSACNQLRIILQRYAIHEVYQVCTLSENLNFANKAYDILIHEKRYRSALLFFIWRTILPIRNIKKLLRFSYEAIE